jgi:hypothetical protein
MFDPNLVQNDFYYQPGGSTTPTLLQQSCVICHLIAGADLPREHPAFENLY